MKISKLMQTNVKTCRTSDSLRRAAQLMWEHDIGAVPVVDDQQHLAGVITDRDIAMAAFLSGRGLGDLPVERSMSREVVTCTPDATVSDCAALMAERQVRRIPVVDGDGVLAGVVSLSDLARTTSSKLPARAVAHTLEQIGLPHRRGKSVAA